MAGGLIVKGGAYMLVNTVDTVNSCNSTKFYEVLRLLRLLRLSYWLNPPVEPLVKTRNLHLFRGVDSMGQGTAGEIFADQATVVA
jgi:hypothetical protein